jgi:small subunit ribosomal protein S8
MLTRIRNGGQARLGRISMPHSKLKMEIARVLAARGFIAGFAGDEDAKKPQMTIDLRYKRDNTPMIEGLERVSRPSRRVYVGWREIPTIRSGLGIAIVSTPAGVMTDEQAREARQGGELLAKVW